MSINPVFIIYNNIIYILKRKKIPAEFQKSSILLLFSRMLVKDIKQCLITYCHHETYIGSYLGWY
jgi:hypothetical protein